MATAEVGQNTGGVPGASSEPLSGTLDLLDTLAVPGLSMDSSGQVTVLLPHLYPSQHGVRQLVEAAGHCQQHRGVFL